MNESIICTRTFFFWPGLFCIWDWHTSLEQLKAVVDDVGSEKALGDHEQRARGGKEERIKEKKKM